MTDAVRPPAVARTRRRERLTIDDGLKLFDAGIDVGSQRAAQADARQYRAGFDAGYLAALKDVEETNV